MLSLDWTGQENIMDVPSLNYLRVFSFTDIIRPAKFDDDDGDEEYPEVERLNPNDRFPQYPPPVSKAQF